MGGIEFRVEQEVCRLSPRLLSNTLGASDIDYFESSHSESLALFLPEAATLGGQIKLS